MTESAKVPPLVEQKLAALDRAFVRAVREHARAGVPVVFGGNGCVVERSAEELLDEIADEKRAGDVERRA